MNQAPKFARHQYKDTWNHLASTPVGAMLNVAGASNEAIFMAYARSDMARVRQMVSFKATDVVLEIGCGVGRLGSLVAPECAKWIGTDVSGKMLEYGRERLAGLDNVELRETNGYDLHEVPDATCDVVYCSVVFMHLDEWDRYSYVLESRRILKPGGVLYVDNFDLETGWGIFDLHRRIRPEDRPTQISKSSTGEELRLFFEYAAFDEIRIARSQGRIMAAGVRSTRPLPAIPPLPSSTDEGYDEIATADNFDEMGYLMMNPDVEAAVKAGVFPSGRAHFDSYKDQRRAQWRWLTPPPSP